MISVKYRDTKFGIDAIDSIDVLCRPKWHHIQKNDCCQRKTTTTSGQSCHQNYQKRRQSHTTAREISLTQLLGHSNRECQVTGERSAHLLFQVDYRSPTLSNHRAMVDEETLFRRHQTTLSSHSCYTVGPFRGGHRNRTHSFSE